MTKLSMKIQEVHDSALRAAKKFKHAEVELLSALEECDRLRVFVSLGYSSLFHYCTRALGLSDEVAYIYINVARKVREVPALKTAIASGEVSLSKARRLGKVLTPENQERWLTLAKTCSKRELEKHIATESPRAAVEERVQYISGDRLQLQLGVDEKLLLRLRRAQDVLSQKRRRPVSLEEALAVLCAEFLRREDPLEIAKRQLARGKLAMDQSQSQQLGPGTVPKSTDKSNRRRTLSQKTRHRVFLRYQGQCAHNHTDGTRCSARRHLDVHHVQPLSLGGSDQPENLELLCSTHHKARHIE